ncbi:MAG TPA: FixH family protein [Verrucomicrobiota bacterium]|nr:FixH family protein [Verrucomicrobiota bacterium]
MKPNSDLSVPLNPSWNPWPHGLAAFLSLFACAVAGMGIFATRHNQDLVSPDYYEQEIRYQEQIDRVTRTQALTDPVTVALSPDGRTLELRLPVAAQGTVQLYRPAEARLDREFPLALDAQGRQRLDLNPLKPGLWRARVQWQQGGQEFFRAANVILPER